MWLETSEGLINLEHSERVAIVGEINVHIFRSGGSLLAALPFPSEEEAQELYDKITIALGLKTAPMKKDEAYTDLRKAMSRGR